MSGSSFTTGGGGPRVQYDTDTFGLKAASVEGPYAVVAQVCLPVNASLTGAYFFCTSAKATMQVNAIEHVRGRKTGVAFLKGLSLITEIPAHVISGAVPTVHLTQRAVRTLGQPLELIVSIPRGETFQGVVLRFSV